MPTWLDHLRSAREHAQAGRFAEVTTLCAAIVEDHPEALAAYLDAGALLLSCGLLGEAERCFEAGQAIAGADLRPLVNLANLAQQRGDHALARQRYARLLGALPDHPVIRRNALTSLEYDATASDRQRLAAARDWGRWAEHRAGGPRRRPPRRPIADRALRVGYVSADLCQHTVGLFVKEVLAAHDHGRVEPFAYSAGAVNDWVTKAIAAATRFRDVRQLDDQALAERIRADAIDVLVDLSGHTGGSRLTVFAHRPAPLQVSWLGYFATTGLGCMDAVLLDAWHAPPEIDAYFTERVIRLPQGRLCYAPPPFVPRVAAAPHARTGVITFGSFNNTAKLSEAVLALWAQVLLAVPESRLVLKWRTLGDADLRTRIHRVFAAHGVEPGRVELRGPSFHARMLKEYGDIDIALDPFPFTGGMTSCEALWMGVPVITWPQSRVVSRQTLALLAQIGLPELAARDADDYVRLATELALDRPRLAHLRQTLRPRMAASPLCNLPNFTKGLEQALIEAWKDALQTHSGDEQLHQLGSR